MKKTTTIVFALLVAFGLNVSAAPANDGEILEIVKTANNAEIAAAELAKTNATTPKVREFAASMSKEHGKNNKDAEQLAKKANVSFQENDQSVALRTEADTQLGELKNKPGSSRAFDRAYIEQQIAMHKSLINDLDKTLIPTAKNAEVKDFLRKTKSHVEHHLSEATKLLSEL